MSYKQNNPLSRKSSPFNTSTHRALGQETMEFMVPGSTRKRGRSTELIKADTDLASGKINQAQRNTVADKGEPGIVNEIKSIFSATPKIEGTGGVHHARAVTEGRDILKSKKRADMHTRNDMKNIAKNTGPGYHPRIHNRTVS